jgi:hypothetical protein
MNETISLLAFKSIEKSDGFAAIEQQHKDLIKKLREFF